MTNIYWDSKTKGYGINKEDTGKTFKSLLKAKEYLRKKHRQKIKTAEKEINKWLTLKRVE